MPTRVATQGCYPNLSLRAAIQISGLPLTVVVLWSGKLLMLHIQLGGAFDGGHVVAGLTEMHAQHLVGIAVGSSHHGVVATVVVAAAAGAGAGGGGQADVGAAAAKVHGALVAHTHIQGARDEEIRKAESHQGQHQQGDGQKQIVGPLVAQRTDGPLLAALAQTCKR